MTKRVRIENADNGTSFKVLVQVWDKAAEPDMPDVLAQEIHLDWPTAVTDESLYITSTRYIVVKELAPSVQEQGNDPR